MGANKCQGSLTDGGSRGKSLKIALVSFLLDSEVERNLLSIVHAVESAHAKGCKLVCFPECALTPGLPSEEYEHDLRLATEIPGEITRRIGALAKNYKVYIAIGLLEREGEKLFDAAVLFDDKGGIILKYRRINPQWHSRRAPKNLYKQGRALLTAHTRLGRIAFAICGDMFDDSVIRKIKAAKPDYLIVPMSRSFEDYSYDLERWEEEKWVYARQVSHIGVTAFLEVISKIVSEQDDQTTQLHEAKIVL